MTLIGFRASNHPQQTARRGVDRDVDDRAITVEDWAPLNARFGPFTVDAASSLENRRCPLHWTAETDGLAQDWSGHRVWCNPPFSTIAPWVRKAWAEAGRAEVIVMLLPANRTEQTWWQELVEPYRDRPGSALRTEFLPGRMRFLAAGQASVKPNERPPFGCVLLIWERVGPTAEPTLFGDAS